MNKTNVVIEQSIFMFFFFNVSRYFLIVGFQAFGRLFISFHYTVDWNS